ncbi:hypothetical protein [Comamonas terrae]|uniref:DUF2190 family protein n=1 Tax=Comamonas terrae TaxID=673548 RepID=A0ABW5UN22_9BURK|nr:hypothetical protein [Comamonas terrae]
MSALPEFEISAAHALVRLQATQVFADSGPGASTVKLYDAAEQLLATLTLTRPCGTITEAGYLQLTQAQAGELILASGVAVYGVWGTSDGRMVARGDVTDEAGAGVFRLLGTSGTQLYAGGLVILGETLIY